MSKEVLVEVSARHVHVSQEALEILFGKGYQLTPKKDLSQPGQFACVERVAVVGEKSSFPAVSILGPVRKEVQVELSATDARTIGVKAPVRARFHIYGQTTVAERCEVRARRKFVIIIVISVGIYDESAVLQQRQYDAVAYRLERSAGGSRFFDGFFGYRDLQGHVAVLVLVEIQSYAGVA